MITVQVQAVIFHNEVAPLKKMAQSFENAAHYFNRNSDEKMKLCIFLGDASEKPLFTAETIAETLGITPDDTISIQYEAFGFNSGYGKGHNILAEKTDAKYLCIINPDILVSGTFFKEMLRPFAAPKTGIVEARQTPVEHPKAYDKETKETDWAVGACFMIPRNLYQKAKGFDTDAFFMYCEDVDLSWRIRMMGYKIIYQPLAPAFHPKKLSVHGRWLPPKSEVYYSAFSQMMLAWKWDSDEKLQYFIDAYTNSKDELCQKALKEFLERKENGTLPPKMKNVKIKRESVNRFDL